MSAGDMFSSKMKGEGESAGAQMENCCFKQWSKKASLIK